MELEQEQLKSKEELEEEQELPLEEGLELEKESALELYKEKVQVHQHRLLMAHAQLRLSQKEKYTKVGIVATLSSPWYNNGYIWDET